MKLEHYGYEINFKVRNYEEGMRVYKELENYEKRLNRRLRAIRLVEKTKRFLTRARNKLPPIKEA